MLVLFYEKLYNEAMKDIERDDKIIKEPMEAIERIKNLNDSDKISELIYLFSFGLEKLKWNIK